MHNRKIIGQFTCLCLLLLSVLPALFAADDKDFLAIGRNETPFPVTQWEPMLDCRFDDPAALEKFVVIDGKWQIADGKLWAVEGDSNRSILLCHPQGEGIRVELTVTNYADDQGRIGDITILLNTAPGKGYFYKGYALTTGSYYNTCTTFYRQKRKLARTELSPLEAGRPCTVVLEQYRGHIRYWVDNRIVLETWDPDPLPLDEQLWIGLRTWATRMAIDAVTISRAAVAEK